MSIFKKDCPRCGEANTASANSCGCGFIFDADTDSYQAVELVSQEQEFYEAYLAARLEQARRTAEMAIETLAADPMNKSRAEEADKANRELEQINNEYEAQLGALTNARQQAALARQQALAERKRLAAQAEQARKLSAEKKKVEALQQRRANMSGRPPMTTRQVAEKVVADFAKLEPVEASKPSAREVARARAGRTRFNSTEAIRARRAAQAIIAEKAAAVSNRRITHFSMPPQLKDEVSKKAERVVRHARRSLENITENLAAAAQALNGRGTGEQARKQHQFRLAQQDRLAASSQARPGTDYQECPNCTALIAKTSAACRCGYSFGTTGADMPGISLGADDAAKLSEFI